MRWRQRRFLSGAVPTLASGHAPGDNVRHAQGLRQIYRVDAGGRHAPEPVVTLPWRDPYCMPVGRTQPTAFVCSAADYTSDVWTLNDLGGERGGTER